VTGLVAGLRVWHGATAAWAIAGVTVGAAGAAGLFLLGFNRSRQLSVQVYSGGLAYRAKGTEETWTWDEVEEYFVLAEEREIHGGAPHGIVTAIFSSLLETPVKAVLPKAARYQVRYRICRPGHQRTFDSQVRGYARLGAVVEDFVTRAQLPKALASFGSGQSIRFGELEFGPDGLRYASAHHPVPGAERACRRLGHAVRRDSAPGRVQARVVHCRTDGRAERRRPGWTGRAYRDREAP
jgi:hypothetical protein